VFLWRVSNYATLDGVGGLFTGGRWHSRGRRVVYTCLNPATALLETLVHLEIDQEDQPEHFQVLKIAGANSISRERINLRTLPADWEHDTALSPRIGNQWLESMSTALLEVPSVLVPETWNVLVNSAHPEAAELRIEQIYRHPLDMRLLK
jgi:RES domain-containing protein